MRRHTLRQPLTKTAALPIKRETAEAA